MCVLLLFLQFCQVLSKSGKLCVGVIVALCCRICSRVSSANPVSLLVIAKVVAAQVGCARWTLNGASSLSVTE